MRGLWYGLVTALLFTVPAGAAEPPPGTPRQVLRAQLHFLPEGVHPDLYLLFDNGPLYLAPREEGLEKTTPIQPQEIRNANRPNYLLRYYPWQKLSAAATGPTMEIAFAVHSESGGGETLSSKFELAFRSRARDRDGQAWECVRIHTEEQRGPPGVALREYLLPTWEALKPVLIVEAKGGQIRLAVLVGPQATPDITKVTHNGTSVLVHLQVRDEGGALVKELFSPLDSLGFG